MRVNVLVEVRYETLVVSADDGVEVVLVKTHQPHKRRQVDRALIIQRGGRAKQQEDQEEDEEEEDVADKEHANRR